MPDDGSFRGFDARFDRLSAGDFGEFRAAATGGLKDQLGLVEDFAPDPIDFERSDAWVYRRGGVIRGIGALTQRMPWCWVLWSFPGELSLADWKRVMRFTRLRLESCFGDAACRRIEASASIGNAGASLLLERLGFELEGVMQCYGPRGEAHRLYAIVREKPGDAHG